jgi:hypothetical protein
MILRPGFSAQSQVNVVAVVFMMLAEYMFVATVVVMVTVMAMSLRIMFFIT